MATFGHRMGNFTFNHITLPNSAKWPHLCIFGKRVTNQNILGSRFHARKKFIGNIFMQIKTRTGYTALTGGTKNARNGAIYRTFDIGIIKDDNRRFTA